MRSPPADRCPITYRWLERFPAADFAKSRGRGSSGQPRPTCDGRSGAYPAGGQVAWWDRWQPAKRLRTGAGNGYPWATGSAAAGCGGTMQPLIPRWTWSPRRGRQRPPWPGHRQSHEWRLDCTPPQEAARARARRSGRGYQAAHLAAVEPTSRTSGLMAGYRRDAGGGESGWPSPTERERRGGGDTPWCTRRDPWRRWWQSPQ